MISFETCKNLLTNGNICAKLSFAACMGFLKLRENAHLLGSESNERNWCLQMFAIVETGGKQYKVSEVDIIFVEKLNIEEGETYTFEKVLAIADDNGFVAGNPTVNATVTASVVKNGKGKKIHVIKYKPKKDSKKHIGHRQPYTKLQILSISK